jgi:hypothetical protein
MIVEQGNLSLNPSFLPRSFFRTLNLLVPILDPVLCTVELCQKGCPLLFTSILTITSKVLRPRAYRSCLLLANKLMGQVVEQGQCSVEVVQAILILVHFKEPEDSTGWRRIGYAIRMALELRLNHFRPKTNNHDTPSQDTTTARRHLNGQRTWLNLLISDYHMAIHHSLPRMITDDGIEDVDAWVNSHSSSIAIRGENILPALIEFSRMCRLYADLLEALSGDASSLRLLAWVERKWQRWRRRYVIREAQEEREEHGMGLEQLQVATLLLCDRFYRFHIAEYKLLFRVRYHSESTADIDEPTKLSFAFNECVEAALGPASIFESEYLAHNLLPYASNILWVAVAVTSVWLIRVSAVGSGTKVKLSSDPCCRLFSKESSLHQ